VQREKEEEQHAAALANAPKKESEAGGPAETV
jgi:DHA1 family multidrug resistance protein-like MFS transporter